MRREIGDYRFKKYNDIVEMQEADKDKYSAPLRWNVIIEDWNSGFQVYNVFDHGSFWNDLVALKRKHLPFNKFEEGLHRLVSYYYGSKAEWEIVVTSWPPYVESEEIDRLVAEREDRIKRWGKCVREDVRLSDGEKVDVMEQLKINWTLFVDYIRSHMKYIKPLEK